MPKGALRFIMEDGLDFENIVIIVSYEEFVDLMYRTGNDPLTTMELVDAIANINSLIIQASKYYGEV